MKHKVKQFHFESLEGFSASLISQHRDVLYKGYVDKLNEIEEKLKGANLATANQTYSEFRALKAAETFALNAVMLHELYFENLGKGRSKPEGRLVEVISREFGNLEKWSADFLAAGMAARGWAVAALNHYDGRLHNYCLDSHNAHVPLCTTPIVVMDVYEHAYALDYGPKRQPYIEAFMKNIDWAVPMERLSRVNMEQILKAAS